MDPTFALPSGWSPGNFNARRFECLVEVLSQHVLFARLRFGLDRRGWTLDSFVAWLTDIDFPAGGQLAGPTIKKAATGEYRLDPRDRGVIEAFCEPFALGPSAYGGAVELHRVVAGMTALLGVVMTMPADPPRSRSKRPGAARPTGASVRGTPAIVDKINELIDKHPDIFEILDDVGRLQVKADPTGVGGPKPPSATAYDLAAPALGRAMANLRRPVTAYYRQTGEIGPKDRLPNLELHVDQGDDEDDDDVEGWIEPGMCFIRIKLPTGWVGQVGQPGWGLLGGRFVSKVVSSVDGRPSVVRALAMMVEDYLEVARVSEPDTVGELSYMASDFRPEDLVWAETGIPSPVSPTSARISSPSTGYAGGLV